MIKNNAYVERHTLELTDEEYKEFNALFSNLSYEPIYHACLYVCKDLVNGRNTNGSVLNAIDHMNSNSYIETYPDVKTKVAEMEECLKQLVNKYAKKLPTKNYRKLAEMMAKELYCYTKSYRRKKCVDMGLEAFRQGNKAKAKKLWAYACMEAEFIIGNTSNKQEKKNCKIIIDKANKVLESQLGTTLKDAKKLLEKDADLNEKQLLEEESST